MTSHNRAAARGLAQSGFNEIAHTGLVAEIEPRNLTETSRLDPGLLARTKARPERLALQPIVG
jgi:hypothetical protein